MVRSYEHTPEPVDDNYFQDLKIPVSEVRSRENALNARVSFPNRSQGHLDGSEPSRCESKITVFGHVEILEQNASFHAISSSRKNTTLMGWRFSKVAFKRDCPTFEIARETF